MHTQNQLCHNRKVAETKLKVQVEAVAAAKRGNEVIEELQSLLDKAKESTLTEGQNTQLQQLWTERDRGLKKQARALAAAAGGGGGHAKGKA